MRSAGILVVLFVGVRLSNHQQTPVDIHWCEDSLSCRHPTSHSLIQNTMCKYSEEMNKGICTCMSDSMTPFWKYVILAMHNTFRNKMAGGNVVKGWPPAADMRQLTWDNELAESALRWAFQCERGNDVCRKTPQFPNVAQNADAFESRDFHVTPKLIFSHWIGESSKAPPKIIGNYTPDKQYQRFTNIVWSRTRKIGCGLINHTIVFKLKFRNVLRLVCNLAPGGNLVNRQVYLPGAPCSRCFPGKECNNRSTYPNLCASIYDPPNQVPLDVPIYQSGSPLLPKITYLVLLVVLTHVPGSSMFLLHHRC